jgi:hypothetical protein
MRDKDYIATPPFFDPVRMHKLWFWESLHVYTSHVGLQKYTISYLSGTRDAEPR